MNSALICIVIVIMLFIASYFSKKKFGILGLALPAGYILSDIWQYDAGLLAGFLSIRSGLMTTMVISIIIILLPPIVLMFSGGSYKKQYSRVIGSLLFSLTALAFLIEPMSKVILPVGFGSFIYSWLIENSSFLVGIGIVFAIIDLLLTKKPVEFPNKKRSH